MYDLDEILIQSVKVRASDIHLTTGRPPSYRIDGILAPIEGERLTPQMLEQIVAKMGIPPFLLGLSWSSTERMSSQQADMLTSELTAYRRILEPAVLKICKTWLRLNGLDDTVEIDWNEITMQDEVDHANAAYLMAKTEQLLKEGEA